MIELEQKQLGYVRWENFQIVINRAMESCEASGHAVSDHLRGVTKMLERDSGSKCTVDHARGFSPISIEKDKNHGSYS